MINPPKRRGRPPGSKTKVKTKPVVKAKARKLPAIKGLPRTARAYMYRVADRRFDTESAAVVELIRRFDEALNRLTVERINNARPELKLGGLRQFFVNLFAGQSVKVLPRK